MLAYKPVKDLSLILSLIWQNKPLVTAICGLIVAQVLKFVFYYIKTRQVNFRHLVSASGMPSSHTAMVAGLATAVGLHIGWNTPSFAIAFIFACIVMYDAAGVRRAAGRQARVLNQILDDIFHRGKFRGERLTELLGHTPLEVFAGAILGIFVAFMMY